MSCCFKISRKTYRSARKVCLFCTDKMMEQFKY